MNKTNHYRGKENPHYKYGAGEFVRKRAEIKAKIGKCERCGKDLTNAGRYEWVVHHKIIIIMIIQKGIMSYCVSVVTN